MFEHLGYIPETTIKKNNTRFSVYLSVFFAALIVFILTISFSASPQSVADELSEIKIKISANNTQQSLVVEDSRLSLFDFIVETNTKGIVLNELKIYADGLYDPEILVDLKLYHNGSQLGQVNKIDDAGFIYFSVDDYPLNSGSNLFSFLLSSENPVVYSKIFQFSLRQANDIIFSYQGNIFTPDGNFPIIGATTSILTKGNIIAYNLLSDNNFPVLKNKPFLIGSFALSNQGETIDINRVILSGLDKDITDDFVLFYQDKIVAQTKAFEGFIDFNLLQKISLDKSQKNNFYIYTLGLSEQQFDLYLDNIVATGFLSGESIGLEKSLLLSKVNILEYYPEFKNGQINEVLNSGWNQIYDFDIKAHGRDNLNFYKLTWLVKSAGLTIDQSELWVDNYQYPVNFVWQGDYLQAIFAENKPLIIDAQGTNIKLLVRISDTVSPAFIQTLLLNDDVYYDNMEESNIVWSVDGEHLFNSYNLPNFPLTPNLLNN